MKMKFKGNFSNMLSIKKIREKKIAKEFLSAAEKLPLADLFGFLMSK